MVFNCTGLGSKTLFGDNDLTAVSQLVWVKRKEDEGFPEKDYMISSPAGYLFARKGEYVIGGTYEKNIWLTDPEDSVGLKILEGHKKLFNFQ